ncbi:MAG TPA: DUF1573 domain-containing protein [Vicinamibacteria bacterium]|nr:DUF1573 domain-containing protein [Vicinamibacteria bacterium]
MKVLFAILAFSLFAGGPLAAQPSKGARMEIEPAEHDFGAVRQDQKLTHDFLVRNTGTEDLTLLRIATSCGCAAALPAERVVPPGGSTTLQVTLETRKYKGAVERSVSIASNDRRRVATVRVRAFVEVPEP